MRKGVDCKGREWKERELSCVMKDLREMRFGMLTPLFPVTIVSKSSKAFWLCQCDCGKEVVVRGTDLKLGKTTSCGSCARRKAEAVKRQDLTGEIFGRLTVLDFAYVKNQTSYWYCKCVCGNKIIVRGADLKNGHTSSCGCMLSIGELNIANILNKFNINFLHNKGYFKDLVSDSGLLLRYDFIILDNEAPIRLIEFDGPQHYNPNELFGIEEFEKLQQYDMIKNQYALSHNIPLVRIPYKKRDNITLEDLLGDKFLIKGEI